MSTGAPAPGTMPGAAPLEVDISIGGHYRIRAIDLSAGVGATVSAGRSVVGGDCHALIGWRIIEETGAAAASFTLHDGSSSGGALVGAGDIAAGADDTLILPCPGAVLLTGKLYLGVGAGSVYGLVYVILGEH